MTLEQMFLKTGLERIDHELENLRSGESCEDGIEPTEGTKRNARYAAEHALRAGMIHTRMDLNCEGDVYIVYRFPRDRGQQVHLLVSDDSIAVWCKKDKGAEWEHGAVTMPGLEEIDVAFDVMREPGESE